MQFLVHMRIEHDIDVEATFEKWPDGEWVIHDETLSPTTSLRRLVASPPTASRARIGSTLPPLPMLDRARLGRSLEPDS